MRRVKFLAVSPGEIMSLFKKGLKVRGGFKVIKGAPADAKVLTVTYEARLDKFLIVIESDSYDEVPDTQMPEIEPVEIVLNSK